MSGYRSRRRFPREEDPVLRLLYRLMGIAFYLTVAALLIVFLASIVVLAVLVVYFGLIRWLLNLQPSDAPLLAFLAAWLFMYWLLWAGNRWLEQRSRRKWREQMAREKAAQPQAPQQAL